MVFNLTSCGKPARRGGFTLVEFLIASSIGVVVLSTALILWAFASRTSASLLGYVDLAATSKNALARISRQIRNAKGIQNCSSNSLTLQLPGHTGANMNLMTYTYDSTNKLLRQTLAKNAGFQETKTLLTDCTNFSFSVYQRTPISNSYVLYTNAWSTNTAKVVEMRWVCTRAVTGDKKSIETQASAKVVIRNK